MFNYNENTGARHMRWTQPIVLRDLQQHQHQQHAVVDLTSGLRSLDEFTGENKLVASWKLLQRLLSLGGSSAHISPGVHCDMLSRLGSQACFRKRILSLIWPEEERSPNPSNPKSMVLGPHVTGLAKHDLVSTADKCMTQMIIDNIERCKTEEQQGAESANAWKALVQTLWLHQSVLSFFGKLRWSKTQAVQTQEEQLRTDAHGAMEHHFHVELMTYEVIFYGDAHYRHVSEFMQRDRTTNHLLEFEELLCNIIGYCLRLCHEEELDFRSNLKQILEKYVIAYDQVTAWMATLRRNGVRQVLTEDDIRPLQPSVITAIIFANRRSLKVTEDASSIQLGFEGDLLKDDANLAPKLKLGWKQSGRQDGHGRLPYELTLNDMNHLSVNDSRP